MANANVTGSKKPTDLKDVSLAEQLQPLLSAYARWPTLHLAINNKLDTSCTALATKTPNSGQYEPIEDIQVFLTNRLIPKKYRSDEDVLGIFLKGELAHEAGHILYSRSKISAENWLIANRYSKELVGEISNIVDDCWINSRLKIAFNVDPLARTFDIFSDVSYRAWLKMLSKQKTNPQTVLSSIWLYVLSGSISKSYKAPQLKGEALKIAEKIRGITGNVSVMSMANTNSKFSGAYWRDNVVIPIYNLVKPLYMGQSGVPKQIHGSGFGDGQATGSGSGDDGDGNETLDEGRGKLDLEKELEEALGEVVDLDKLKAEKDAKAKAEGKDGRDGKGDKGSGADSEGSYSYGKGTGREIPALKANRGNYLRLVRDNSNAINELLRKLPQLTKPQLVIEEFQRHGRLMTQMLGRVYSQSLVSEVPNVYEYATTRNEKTRVKMGVIVDFSGSMNTEGSRDAITVISEVLYRWLPSDDFAIFAFGSEFSRIKTFDESYDTTRFRLGGTMDMGGTELGTPLRTMIKAMDALGADDPRVIVIFTDMAVDDVSKEVAMADKLGIKIMVLGPFWQEAERFGLRREQMKAVRDIEKLPDAFVKVYQKLGLGPMEQKGASPVVYGQR